MYENVIDLLGKKGKDKITGFKGIITSVSFDLYGCIQVILNPGKVGKDRLIIPTTNLIDLNRIEIVEDRKVMQADFSKDYKKAHGPENKPII